MIDFVFYLVVGLIISLIWNCMYATDSHYAGLLLSLCFYIPAFGIIFGILMILITPIIMLHTSKIKFHDHKLNRWLFNDDLYDEDELWVGRNKEEK